MRVLAIETATDVCSVAVTDSGVASFERTLVEPRRHGELLAPMISEALASLGGPEGRARKIDCVAVSAGPGSYTGLRIGVSSAKGLALALDVPMVAVPTLECLAMCAKTPARLSIVSLLHARKNEWYAAIYQRVADVTERLLEIRPAAIVSFDEWLSFVERHDDVAVVTDSAGARALLGSNLRLQEVHPHAAAVATIGDRRLETGEIVDLETFEPAYLRDFVARKPKQSIFEKLRF